ncbi:uncharacterized protein METZ01_LOCUS84068, partial [marine metagenome]
VNYLSLIFSMVIQYLIEGITVINILMNIVFIFVFI